MVSRKFERVTEIDRGPGVIFLRPAKSSNQGRLIYNKPAKDLGVNDEQIRRSIDSAYEYLERRGVEKKSKMSDVIKAVAAGSFFVGMTAMYVLVYLLKLM